jgi:hypothetical protein
VTALNWTIAVKNLNKNQIDKQIKKMKTLIKQSNVKMKVLTILLLLTATISNAQRPADFTGTWLRNTAKCDAGSLSINSIPFNISVEQNKGQIQIKRNSKTAQGDSTAYTEKIKFDGSPVTSLVKSNLNKSATVSWSADHNQLTETSNYSDGQGNLVQKTKENWSLSEDGKTLNIQAILIADGRDFELTMVFDKK